MAAVHPQVVQVTIALAIVGVLFRVLAFAWRPAFLSPAATALLVLAAISSVVVPDSGEAAD